MSFVLHTDQLFGWRVVILAASYAFNNSILQIIRLVSYISSSTYPPDAAGVQAVEDLNHRINVFLVGSYKYQYVWYCDDL